MPVFRFDKAFRIARDVKAFLHLEGGVTRDAAPDADRHGNKAESPKNSRQRPTSEQRNRNEGKGQRSRIQKELRAARGEAARSEHKKRKKGAQHETVTQRGSDKPRDPPLERIETAQLRQLPDFVIIGTQRGGTTSLYRYLTGHPDIGPALRKEVHFFDHHYEKGIDWYLAHFPVRGEVPIVGEASPYYLFHRDVPERARRVVPYAKFIALLRNPVDRAYSHYQMRVSKGLESLSFEDAIDKEPERLSGDDPSGLTWRHHSYIRRGLYVDQLKRWVSVFPREQLLIIKSEDFYKEPEQILQQTLAHLGLQPWSPAKLKAHHLSEYADMDPVTRERLKEYFAPHNEQLYAFLGRDLGWENE